MIQVDVDVGEEWDSRTDWAALAHEAVQAAVRHSSFPDLAGEEPAVEVSVKLTTNEEVQALNSAWRGKDKPTNVLSFPMMEPDLLRSIARADRGELMLGDIALAHGICAAEAADKDVAVETHASHLVVHGALHLLGYDHELGDEEAEEMEAIEREALAAIGISDPYHVTEVQS